MPNLYIGVPFTDKWSFGLGVNVPFGLKTEYDSDWLGRFQAIKSERARRSTSIPRCRGSRPTVADRRRGRQLAALKASSRTVNYAAAFAQGVRPRLAAGQIPAAAVPTLVGAGAGLESERGCRATTARWGWNVGVLWQVDARHTRRRAYRSKIKYDVSGSANFNNPASLGTLPPTLAPVGAAIAAGVNNVLSQR